MTSTPSPSVAPGPLELSPLGSMTAFRAHPIDFCADMASRYGDVCQFRIGPITWHLVLHPDHVHDLLVTRAARTRKPDLANQFWAPFLGQGLLSSEGELWKRQHRLVLPGFRRERIDSYADVMVSYTDRLVDRWKNGETRDIADDMAELTCDIVCKTLFDSNVGADSRGMAEAMFRLNDVLIEHVHTIVPRPRWWPSPANRRKYRTISEIEDLVLAIVNERRREGRDHGDLLSQLVFAEDENGERMSDKQLRDEAVTLFFAGHETTSLAMTWLWYLVAKNPRVEQKLREELHEVLGDRLPTVSDLSRMPYLEMVVKESLRMRPPVWSFMREPMDEIQLGEHVVPAGALVFVCSYLIHNDARWFDDPQEFRPERFSKENEKTMRKGSYVPFAAGPRVCLGKNFAMMEARLILATVMQRAQLTVPENRDVEIAPMVGLRPEGGMPMTVQLR